MAADNDSAPVPVHRRAYGKGFADGLKRAGVSNIGEVMSQKNLRATLEGTHGMDRKVYESMPQDKTFRSHELVTIMAKGTGSRPDVAIVESCLDRLVEKGLATEQGKGIFKRIGFKPAFVTPLPEPALVFDRSPAPPPPAPGGASPLDRLADLEKTTRDLAGKLSDVASSLGAVALDVQQFVETSKREAAKPTKSKALLRELLESLDGE